MKIGFTCSSFDLLHSGHIMMLKECIENCDYLIVGLHTNPTNDRPHKNYPVQSLMERYIQLRAVSCVDEIFVYETEEDLVLLLKYLKPSIRFLGQEYLNKSFTGSELEIPLHFNTRNHNFSTTELRERVTSANNFLAKDNPNNESIR